ncbi:hypothetical protein ELAC_2222 [Estrella lausannensis]|uniref:Uncharacterized protein n=1 Tax=Estrella lausannensis TaxID=483423 RepID=A0A0H5DS73_9BACT|nr:hypothetical protein ELAC_2222 [Estrella lausannensis]
MLTYSKTVHQMKRQRHLASYEARTIIDIHWIPREFEESESTQVYGKELTLPVRYC